jgi:triosephosphate isomerase
VETRQKLISKGYEPPIHNFSITSPAGTDITKEVLADTGYVFLFIIPDIDGASEKGLQKLNDLALRSRELGIKAIALTASTNSQVDAYKTRFQPAYDFCTTDETTLKTITRANPGILLLSEGTIIGKWSHRDVPSAVNLTRNLLSSVILNQQAKQTRLIIIGLILMMLAIYRFVFRTNGHG